MAAEGLVWRVWHRLGATPGQTPGEPGRAGSQAAASTVPSTHLAQPWSCPQVPPWFPQSPWGCHPGAGQAGLRPIHTGAGPKAPQPEELIAGSTLIVAEAPSSGRTETRREGQARPTPSSGGGAAGGSEQNSGQPHKLPEKGNP